MKTFTQTYIVLPTDTAEQYTSGILPVYATPAMIALMENTATKAIDDLDNDFTTVGIEINAKHLKASPVGETLTCRAELTVKTGKIYEFYIEVINSNGDKIGTATHKRAAVNKTDFMNKLQKK
ncbi:MAG: thioesterase family protein [Paludibacteraceae bacterium]